MSISADEFNEIYKELSELIGIENTLKLYRHLKGQQVSFPVRLYSKDFVTRTVKKEYNGKNSKSLARRYGYSERWIKELLKNHTGDGTDVLL